MVVVEVGRLMDVLIAEPLTMKEANDLAMTTIYSTSDVFKAFA